MSDGAIRQIAITCTQVPWIFAFIGARLEDGGSTIASALTILM
ncbi:MULTISPECIES: hypothetical protein [Pseudomonas]|jgi:hypothetical protein|nr:MULTISPECIES: hypothetical protein [Pseudomonas]WKL53201.1 hypothetical protein Q1W70_00980 [Pseudomonas kielensis]